ncbi:sensor histidine kinase [Paenibacillus hexagrammi]|uniref:Histidine kinase n=1 Tax=Paenibacillus hexagrammi TaxID=2908839 RepID=A0ABY3SKD0_9BACL|nr:histidine kinase [Paenibacillus sp. YPD9-1]UJF33980.1 histidine kinase [Paenibacillus sp. YPD9-1]
MSMGVFKDFMLQLALIATLLFTYRVFFAERAEGNRYEKIVHSVLAGLAILLSMSFPVTIAADYRVDIRIVPLLLGTLYGEWWSGIVLSVVVLLYRLYYGINLGLTTTFLNLLLSIPVFLIVRKTFIGAKMARKLQIVFLLVVYNSLDGLITVSLMRGQSLIAVLQTHFLHILIDVAAVLFFTALNETIVNMIRNNQQLQAEKKETEIAFLRSQIKPHFLYNALNSIAALCLDNEAVKAGELTLDLSKYLRSGFDFKQMGSLTTIENELELVKAYINIEQVRFGDRLGVAYDVDAHLGTPIPPLILQPLVENAVRHGLMSRPQGGTVTISIKQEKDDYIQFTIEDNGCGMSEWKREEILTPDLKKKGIGLWNINQRFRLLYGKSIRVESVEGIGTKISFELPARPVKQTGG